MSLLLASVSGPARAEADATDTVRRWLAPGLFLPMGLSLAGCFRGGDLDGAVLGAEASLVSIDQLGLPGGWLGGFVDAQWDGGSRAFRHGIGPEFGIGLIGVDVSYFGELRDGRYRPGFAARALLTFGVVAAYGRYGRAYDGTDSADFAEFGMLAKFPLRLSRDEPAAQHPSP